MNYWEKSIIGLGLTPYGLIIPLVTFYYYAELMCGHRIWFNIPDPKTFSVYKLFDPIIDVTGHVWLIALPVALVVFTLYVIKSRQNISWKPIIFFVVGQILVFLLFWKSDIPEWYFD